VKLEQIPIPVTRRVLRHFRPPQHKLTPPWPEFLFSFWYGLYSKPSPY